jgi:hypothetical protein
MAATVASSYALHSDCILTSLITALLESVIQAHRLIEGTNQIETLPTVLILVVPTLRSPTRKSAACWWTSLDGRATRTRRISYQMCLSAAISA